MATPDGLTFNYHDESKINSDPSRIQQILTNLLSNAVKFTEKGELSVTAELLPSDSKNSALLHISVADTGIGIPNVEERNLFVSERH